MSLMIVVDRSFAICAPSEALDIWSKNLVSSVQSLSKSVVISRIAGPITLALELRPAASKSLTLDAMKLRAMSVLFQLGRS